MIIQYIITYSATSIIIRGASQHITIKIHRQEHFIQKHYSNNLYFKIWYNNNK